MTVKPCRFQGFLAGAEAGLAAPTSLAIDAALGAGAIVIGREFRIEASGGMNSSTS